ncbi:uncharacterized protein LOC118794456 [Megalops cyprinoides]|uniref:uncharacterized protein LOC118794456 n=1 Tax=Megalops cyprinoides TaxID=118141 RepID=UPI001864A7F7|nr:uncharacterized protein LOC118794456 [Megalops cyprinoides]
MGSMTKYYNNGHHVNGYRKNGYTKDTESESTKQTVQKCISDFSTCSFKEFPALVKKHRGVRVGLESPKGFTLRVTDLGGTIYWGRKDMLETWGELYLPEPEEMVVLGAIDNFPSLAEGLQLIVLVDKHNRVYFYENEELHHVAHKVKDFLTTGAESTPINSYRYGQHCAPETEEEYLEILQSAGIPRIDKATRDFVQSKEEKFSELLDFLEGL